MAFRYRVRDRDMTEATRRIARERADHALAALDGGESLSEALHTARKDSKKLRALLKLVRPDFDDYKFENGALRDAAHGVSALRDRDAMIETFHRVAPGPEAARFFHIRRALEARAPATADEKALVASFAAILAQTRERTVTWELSVSGFGVLEDGLAKTYKRARKRMKDAAKTRTGGALHEWRKRVKVHWYHARLLRNAAPKLMKPHVKLADALGDRLGDHHDLVVFEGLLPDLDVPEADRRAFAARIASQKSDLEDQSFVLGKRLLVDKPKTLVRRWRCWWRLRGD